MEKQVRLKELCPEIFGISEKRYRQIAKEGHVPEPEKGYVNFSEAAKGYIAYLRGRFETHDDSLTEQRRRKTRAEANIKEMQEKQLSGELMERSTVIDEFVRRIYVLKSDLLSIEKRIMRWPEAKAIVAKRVRQILTNYSRPLPGSWRIPAKKGG